MTHIPRIGSEVIVAFLEGDPDQPIIIGCVCNAEQTPPYPLPANKMVQGIKSNTTPGGGGHNGLIMNDTKHKELITLHGQKDMTTTIEHGDTQHIKNNRTIDVDGTHTETIKKDTTITITEGKLEHKSASAPSGPRPSHAGCGQPALNRIMPWRCFWTCGLWPSAGSHS
jgi:type VI secretion system secreted protein VgrG